VVVDDSGIYFDTYPDFPGVLSKYIYKSLGMYGLQKLFVDQPNTHAWFQCVLTYMDQLLSEPIQFIGKVSGHISFDFLDQVVVDSHLPYDAIFQAVGMNGVAQMDMEQFQTFHHRTKASISLKDFLVSRNI
jgi:XTP/dITP diphosphohydrolase